MNTLSMRWLAAAVLLVSGSLAVAQYKAGTDIYARDEQEVRKVERQWAEAMEREDVAVVDKILGEDYTLVDSIGVAAGRAEVLDQLRSGTLKFDSFKTGGIKVRVFQGGAVVTGLASVKGNYKDEDISGEYRFIDVFGFQKGNWKASYSQFTKIKKDD